MALAKAPSFGLFDARAPYQLKQEKPDTKSYWDRSNDEQVPHRKMEEVQKQARERLSHLKQQQTATTAAYQQQRQNASPPRRGSQVLLHGLAGEVAKFNNTVFELLPSGGNLYLDIPGVGYRQFHHSHMTVVTIAPKIDRRADPNDGMYYTKAQFLGHYGGTKQWYSTPVQNDTQCEEGVHKYYTNWA